MEGSNVTFTEMKSKINPKLQLDYTLVLMAGGLGMAPALNLGDEVAIAEPVHGSAPDIAGQGIANPTSAVLSSAMLARHKWGQVAVADRIEAAVHRALTRGDHTADVAGGIGMSTEAFVDAICAELG